MPDDFILLGDFNLSPNDPEYTHLIRADADESDLNDCWTLAGHVRDDGVTFPANPKGQQRIDFAFIGPELKHHPLVTLIDGSAVGSDHQPYWIDFACHIT